MSSPVLILGSASPRRLELLAQIGITPTRVAPAAIDETPHKNELPEPYARRVATEKVKAIAAQHQDAVVLAADTVVFMGRRILPKAEDKETARACLLKLSGRRHRVVTAVAIMRGQELKTLSVVTRIAFKRLSAADIEHYIASGQWEGKAGGYAIQGLAAQFIPWINGSYSNVVGLPLAQTKALLDSFI